MMRFLHLLASFPEHATLPAPFAALARVLVMNDSADATRASRRLPAAGSTGLNVRRLSSWTNQLILGLPEV